MTDAMMPHTDQAAESLTNFVFITTFENLIKTDISKPSAEEASKSACGKIVVNLKIIKM